MTFASACLHAELKRSFPDGVFDAYFGPGDGEVLLTTQQRALLARMTGGRDEVAGPGGTLKEQLGYYLRGKKCLLWLDDVRDSSIVNSFNFDGFTGAVMVTGLSESAWQDAPNEAIFAITPEAAAQGYDNGPSLAMRVLVSRAYNDRKKTKLPDELQVGKHALLP